MDESLTMFTEFTQDINCAVPSWSQPGVDYIKDN